MTVVTAIGMLAAILTTVAFVPQVIKTWRTRSTADISLGMFAILVAGVAAWLIYGLLIRDAPLVLANDGAIDHTRAVRCGLRNVG